MCVVDIKKVKSTLCVPSPYGKVECQDSCVNQLIRKICWLPDQNHAFHKPALIRRSTRHPWMNFHDDVIKWKLFPRYWPFVRGIHRSPVNSLHKGQWRGALMFSLICVRINGWVNNREAGDLRRHLAHYDVSVMSMNTIQMKIFPSKCSCHQRIVFVPTLIHCNLVTPYSNICLAHHCLPPWRHQPLPKPTLTYYQCGFGSIGMRALYQEIIMISVCKDDFEIICWNFFRVSQGQKHKECNCRLTHQDKMAAISSSIFSDAFSWMKCFVFWLKFYWSLFPRVQFTITQHWFR